MSLSGVVDLALFVARRHLAPGELRASQGEVDLEGGVEGPPVVGGLHERRCEGEFDRLTVLEGEMTDGLSRVRLF